MFLFAFSDSHFLLLLFNFQLADFMHYLLSPLSHVMYTESLFNDLDDDDCIIVDVCALH